jgi:hypothetical protein
MTMTARDDRSRESRADARTNWLEHELGDDWVAQGDGTYRFVGATRDEPIARDDSHASGDERAREDASDKRRHPRLPWRRH